MLGRPIVNKYNAYTFQRPSALWLAQIIIDMTFAVAQIVIFCIIVYFMTGCVRDVGAFFIFVLLNISGYLAMALFFRTIGCLCLDFDYAMKFAAWVITLFVLTSGYLLQAQSQLAWLSWIFWAYVLGLSFCALMMNEFDRIDLDCTRESLIPSGPGHNDLEHQVCTLPGSVPSVPSVAGSDYITTAFSYNPSDLWRNWGLIIAWIIFYLILNTVPG